jgi:PKD repeat protein
MTKTLAVMLAAAVVSIACTVHKTQEPGLVGPSTFAVVPPVDVPTARFTVSPADEPVVGQPVLFDARSSCPGPELDEINCRPSLNTISRFVWDFGDGTYGSGPTPTHTFSTPRSYAVTLTVTNDRGLTGLPFPRIVELVESKPPSASFVFSPTAPQPGDTVSFTETSESVSGRKNVLFEWNFGDPNSPDNEAIGNTVSHSYADAGSFVVALIVTDDLGQRSVAATTVVVKAAATTGTGLAPSVSIRSPQP